jgi:hypothetical protein
MKTSKKFFALLAVLTMALTLMPMTVANAQVAPEQKLVVTGVTWGTVASFGLGTATSPVVKVTGKITGVASLDATNLDIYYPGTTSTNVNTATPLARPGSTLNIQTGDFTIYVDFASLANYGDGAYVVWYKVGASAADTDPHDVAPITLGVFTTAKTVPTEVTSGQEVTITGTGTLLSGDPFPVGYSAYEVVIWKNVDGTPTLTATAPFTIAHPGTSTTATFDFTFNAYGPVGTEYYFTVQNADTDQTYHGATYFTVKVTKAADVAVTAKPNTIMVGATTNVTFNFNANDVDLATHVVTVTLAMGDTAVATTATTDSNGNIVIPLNYSIPGIINVSAKVKGPTYGSGSTTIAVQKSAPEEMLTVDFPDPWIIGSDNTVTFATPVSGYQISELKVKVSGPVVENGKTITATSSTSTASVTLRPTGYGVLTLQVTGTLLGTTTVNVSKSFSSSIGGYVVSVDPTELTRNTTVAMTVVVKDAYGNPVNNALVQFFSPANDSVNPIAQLNGTATTVVNNGTYRLTISSASIKNADDSAYVQVKDTSTSKVRGYVKVTILPSEDVTITLDKSQIVLGPKTTLTVTVISPVSLQGAVLSLVDPEENPDAAISWTFTSAATVQKVAVPVETMPAYGAGEYTLMITPVDTNHEGFATVAFVEPKLTASPAELVVGSTVAVTITSANVTDLKSVTNLTGVGVTVKSFTTSTEAITATVVAGSTKGTATVTFAFNSGYTFGLPLSVVLGKVTVGNATITVGTKVLTFKPVDASGATLAAGKKVVVNVLGNEYNGYVGADGTVSVLIPELPAGSYTILVKADGYQDASFTLVIAEPAPVTPTGTTIVLAVNSDIYTINGKTMFWDATPYVKNGRTLVPIRALAEALGFQVTYDFSDPASKAVYIYKATQDIEKEKDSPYIMLVIGQPTAMVNGQLVALDVAPEILNGRTMLPLRFVAQSLGYNVELVGNTIRLSK